jgi:3-hydroxyacyl-CoA dehydrogenase
MLDDALKRVAILGAAGKMGSGISLLLLQEMACKEAEKFGAIGTGHFTLILIDSNEKGLKDLSHYLKEQLRRYAEQSINTIRSYFANNPQLISNEEIIDAFVDGAMDVVLLETETKEAKNAALIFEAIIENADVKAKVFSEIDAASSKKPFYLTNTSSIPISSLCQKSGIKERIIGFHFYNPPPVQRLLEIIPAENTAPELLKIAKEIASRLGKVVVVSSDTAGFIGNGHFIREIDFACKKVKELESQHSHIEAIWIVNRLTQEFLIRPMGIFQLLDYVGLDVAQKIFTIMSTYLKTQFSKDLIEKFISEGIVGGQHPDGSQKNGIFQYEGSRIVKIWDGKKYVDLPKDHLGNPPEGFVPWRNLHKDKNKNRVLESYFKKLFSSNAPGAILAQEFLLNSCDIARQLVAAGVAKSVEDVNTVLINGFYHLYGADNAWIPEEAKTRSET